MEAGFKTIEAVNVDEALQVLQARPDIQVVVTDVQMPGGRNGFDLAREVHQRWPGVGLVVSSGREWPGPDDLPDGAAFLKKPLLPATLVEAVRRLATPQVIDPAAPAVRNTAGGR
jgi:CheY-like chemotaxis protein